MLAQEEARNLGHNYIGVEHLVLGLIREEEGIASRILGSLGFTLDGFRDSVLARTPSGEEVTTGQIPFTPRAKKALEVGLREALSLGHNYIGTEHMLLGIAREGDSIASTIFEGAGITPDRIRLEIIKLLAAPKTQTLSATEARRLAHLQPVQSTASSNIQVGSGLVWQRVRTPYNQHIGWECPKCASVYAPFVDECSRCTKAAAA